MNRFPGYIACASDFRSEIVIPFRYKNKVISVLDIDSHLTARFDDDDRKGLELITSIVEVEYSWSSFVLH